MKIRTAILDLYDGTQNLGMDGIRRMVEYCGLDYDVFDVRAENEVPDLSYDIYIASGGPGDPRETEDSWGVPLYQFYDDLWEYNKAHKGKEKHILFICHSFQMICDHFGVGEITERKSQSFGVFPVHKTQAGEREWLFEPLSDPFYIADFRHYQLLQPREEILEELGAEVVLLEKERPHVPLERAVMGVRFSESWLGVQFHPEAHAAGMIEHFYKKKVKEKVLELKGEQKFSQMIEDLGDPEKLELTHKTIIPGFLRNAIEKLQISRGAVATPSA